MKNPQALINTWNRSLNKEPVLLSVSDANKKFKRKSREPRKLFCSPEPEKMTIYQADMSDDDSVDDRQMEACNVNRLAPLQRALMMSQEVTGSTTGIITGFSESSTSSAQNDAIDMRIGINVPAITAKLSQLPVPPFANPEISHWPTIISEPLPSRLRLGLHSTFPLSASASSSHSHSPSFQDISLDSSLPGQAVALAVSKTSQDSQCHDHMEPQMQSPKESSKKRVGASTDGLGRLPEVKAIQQTRRLLANARERTRVHTISAAFEALRKQVPCYSYGQKLSKLAILRIACNYILSLAQLAELDYSSDDGSLSFSQCVEQCTRTLQAEGRSKKRKVGRMPENV